MKRFKILAVAAGLTVAVLATSAFTVTGSAANKNHSKVSVSGFAVVELFTSEGCSSCPPADELVSRIQKEDADKPVYILAFHVDYWNRLGWKDPFSSADYSKRQNQYANWLNLQSVYTPQIVVNGHKEFVGSEEGTLRNAITAGLRAAPAGGLTLNAQNTAGHIAVQYKAEGAGKNTTLLLALVQKNGQTKVQRGENGGRTLSHVQIVRNLQSVALNTGGTGTANIALPNGFSAAGCEVIGFVQNNGTGAILAAAKSGFDIGTSK
ncbi:DUF1223 domain-containing protein [Mucilaginibacter ginsenosidivorax]|uniref:DUF1223 domain-containing protein n=1 Tax=Mucilaginibacter ginsenosidivorax TaxID=862126 RepID=A0A5B8W031_9SPHI|nr:DUF1223 domain-containing protein [Mucilaginibacter ginsenosidivorax]QEC77149.1 DUF1223 domain-containing protein [Mucilaginibacter ginsenosidivorax]